MDTALMLLVVACVACSAEQGGAQGRPVQSERTIDTTGSPSAMPKSPALEDLSTNAGTAPDGIENSEKRACTTDQDCAPGFCDRDVCATPGKANYGRDECEPDLPPPTYPPPPPGMRWGPPSDASDCSSYLCIDGRCRSCKYDVECGEGLVCKTWPDFSGKSCGKLWPNEPHVVHQPPPMPPLLGVPDPTSQEQSVDSSSLPQPPPPRPKPSR